MHEHKGSPLHIDCAGCDMVYVCQGGQPADTGVISSSDGTVRFEVSHVQKPRDAAYIQHVGKYTTAQR